MSVTSRGCICHVGLKVSGSSHLSPKWKINGCPEPTGWGVQKKNLKIKIRLQKIERVMQNKREFLLNRMPQWIIA